MNKKKEKAKKRKLTRTIPRARFMGAGLGSPNGLYDKIIIIAANQSKLQKPPKKKPRIL